MATVRRGRLDSSCPRGGSLFDAALSRCGAPCGEGAGVSAEGDGPAGRTQPSHLERAHLERALAEARGEDRQVLAVDRAVAVEVGGQVEVVVEAAGAEGEG